MNETMYLELIELLTTDSASGKERAIARLLIEKLEKLGFAVTTDHAGQTFGGDCGNVLGVLEGQLNGSLLLCSHTDRVPNGLGIHPVERDGVLCSDGTTILAADDVSGICAILDGLRRVVASGRPLPRLEVLFTVGEEAGLSGSRAMDLGRLQSRMGYIFDSPGRVGRFVISAPGRCQLDAEITGLAAHAGNEPEKGIELMKSRRKTDKLKNLCSGPGKLCMAMDIDRSLYGEDMTAGDTLYIELCQKRNTAASKRIGIDYAEKCRDMPWRFTDPESPYVSR